jgi:tetratricopeptide (TPR) repeat protein
MLSNKPGPLSLVTAASAVLGVTWLCIAPGTLSGQTPTNQVAQVDVRAEVAAALYAASATQVAAARAADTRIRQQAEEIQNLRAQLESARSGRAEDVTRLQTELTAAEEEFVAALAEQDRAYAQEISVFRDAVEDIASTPEGAAALARFNAGDEIGALAVLDDLRAARDAARRRRMDIESAVEGRRIAMLALEARSRLKLSTSEVIARFEEVTGLDPDVYWDWVVLSRLYTDAGDLPAALQAADRATATAATDRERSIALIELGDVLRDQGNLDDALEQYRASLVIQERLAAADSDDLGRLNDVTVDHGRIGQILADQGDLQGALASYQASLEIRERLAALFPDNADLQRGLVVSHGRVGQMLESLGDLSGALEAHRTALRVMRRLLATEPSNRIWQRDLAFVHIDMGDVLQRQRSFTDAARNYRMALRIRQRLAARDPTNSSWQRDLAVAHERVGNALKAEGDYSGALERYQAALEIGQRLVATDPSNAQWQWGLSLTHDLASDALGWLEDFTGSEDHLRTSLEIKERLAATDPGNAGWQRDLATTWSLLGVVLVVQEDSVGAAQSFRASLEVRERLVELDPVNAVWQRDLLMSYGKMFELTREKEYAEGGVEVAERMEALGILTPRDRWIADSLKRRAGL